MENAFINVKSRSHSIEADVVIPDDGAEGVIICQGGRFAGWSLYMTDGRPAYVHNWFNRELYTIESDTPIEPGPATVRYEFDYDGGDPGSGGNGKLFVNGTLVAEGRIEKTVGLVFSADETADVGVDHHTNVTPAYPQRGNEFTGTIRSVTIEVE